MKQTCLKSEGSEMKAMFILRLCLFTFLLKPCLFQVGSGAASRSSPAVLSGSVIQHLCLDTMYRIQAMKGPKDCPRGYVGFMNEWCNMFQRYLKHIKLFMHVLTRESKKKHNPYLGDAVKALLLVITIVIKYLFSVEETNGKRMTEWLRAIPIYKD